MPTEDVGISRITRLIDGAIQLAKHIFGWFATGSEQDEITVFTKMKCAAESMKSLARYIISYNVVWKYTQLVSLCNIIIKIETIVSEYQVDIDELWTYAHHLKTAIYKCRNFLLM